MKNLYETLGIGKTANNKEVRKAYLMKAKVHHPDKDGSIEEFNQISTAYQILMDDDKRKRYDKGETVEQILKANNNKAQSILADILCKVLENWGPQAENLLDPKTQDIVKTIDDILIANMIQIEVKILKTIAEQKNYEIFLKRIKKKKKGSFFMIDVAKAQVEVKKTLVKNLKKEEAYFEEAKKINSNYDYEVDYSGGFVISGVSTSGATTC